jgi:hypothetical protein
LTLQVHLLSLNKTLCSQYERVRYSESI